MTMSLCSVFSASINMRCPLLRDLIEFFLKASLKINQETPNLDIVRHGTYRPFTRNCRDLSFIGRPLSFSGILQHHNCQRKFDIFQQVALKVLAKGLIWASVNLIIDITPSLHVFSQKYIIAKMNGTRYKLWSL